MDMGGRARAGRDLSKTPEPRGGRRGDESSTSDEASLSLKGGYMAKARRAPPL